MEEKSTAKRITVIVCAVLAVLLLAVLLLNSLSDIMRTRSEERYKEEIAPLLLRKSALEQSIIDIENEYMSDAPCGANTSLLFVDLDAPLYDLFLTVEEREHLSGIICFSTTELPDLEGKITHGQLEEMLRAGWTTAFYWDGEGELAAHLYTVKDTLTSLGLPMTDTILFEKLRYDQEYDELLASFGIRFAIHHGDGSNTLVDKEIRRDVLHPGVVGWNASGYGKAFLMSVEMQKGVAAFCVTFERGEDLGSYYDPTREDFRFYFEKMLDAINESAEYGTVTCTSLAEAYINREGYVDAYNAMEGALGAAKEEIYHEIALIEEQMLEIRKKYE